MTDVLDLVQRWAAAEQENDAGRLEGLLADDFVGVGPLGFVLSREHPRQRPHRAPAAPRWPALAVGAGVLRREGGAAGCASAST
jgi:hypothetical protein